MVLILLVSKALMTRCGADKTERYLPSAVEMRHVLSCWVDTLKKQPCVKDLCGKHTFAVCAFGTLDFLTGR